MHPTEDFRIGSEPDEHATAVVADLGLGAVLDAMSGGDPFFLGVATAAVLSGLDDPGAIAYRQDVLRDCMADPGSVRVLYDLAVAALEVQRKVWRPYARSPESVLRWGVESLGMLMESLRELRRFATDHAGELSSAGFRRFFAVVGEELDDAYLDEVTAHLDRLGFRQGMLLGADLGPTNRGAHHTVRVPAGSRLTIGQRLGLGARRGLSFTIAERDEAGIRALGQLKDRGVAGLADAVSRSVDHVVGFFECLRTELAFHLGCCSLAARLDRSVPRCFPTVVSADQSYLSGRTLCDPGLALRLDGPVVGNDLQADGRALVVVTGANQGGKSTWLRSVGIAQLLAQAGMFVTAESWTTSVRRGVFTHFAREEDTAMVGGKLDEELLRMSGIVDLLAPGSMVLSNESFASTNEREGSEIARQVFTALAASGVTVLAVTHLFELADGLNRQDDPTVLFLRAVREEDGRRPFRLVEAEPLPTSYGRELFEREFGVRPDGAPTLGGLGAAPEKLADRPACPDARQAGSARRRDLRGTP